MLSNRWSKIRQIVVVASMFVMQACVSEQTSTTVPEVSVATIGTNGTPVGVWAVLEAGGRPKLPGAVLTITADQIHGELFCNRYGGDLELTGNGSFIVMGSSITTAMCGPIEDETVAAVVGFLGRVTTWELSENEMTLTLGSEYGVELLLER